MRTFEGSVGGFRRRLQVLIAAQDAGKYTRLARRAGIPVTTMEHYMRAAVRLPGGEHLMRLATALGVSVDFLLSGEAAVRPADLLSYPALLKPVRGFLSGVEGERHLVIPILRCTCPAMCPLTEAIPPITAAGGRRLVLPAALAPVETCHRLIALEVDDAMPSPEWPTGTRLVVNWDARESRWEALMLVHVDGRCLLGHAVETVGTLLFAARLGDPPRAVAGEYRLLGQVVAAVAPCGLPVPEGGSPTRTGGSGIR